MLFVFLINAFILSAYLEHFREWLSQIASGLLIRCLRGWALEQGPQLQYKKLYNEKTQHFPLASYQAEEY